MRVFLFAPALALIPSGAVSQTPEHLSESQEVALALSAAPASLTDDATVLVLRNGRYAVYREGSNGVTCMVERSRPLSMEPICYDPEASRTIMPVWSRRVELRLAGLNQEEIESREEASFASGEFTAPSSPALAYMMSAGQVLYNDDTTRIGQWYPHMHIFSPYATRSQHGLTGEPSLDATLLIDEGKPTASMVVVLREFVEPSWSDD